MHRSMSRWRTLTAAVLCASAAPASAAIFYYQVAGSCNATFCPTGQYFAGAVQLDGASYSAGAAVDPSAVESIGIGFLRTVMANQSPWYFAATWGPQPNTLSSLTYQASTDIAASTGVAVGIWLTANGQGVGSLSGTARGSDNGNCAASLCTEVNFGTDFGDYSATAGPYPGPGPAPVPLPGAAALLLGGVAALAGLRGLGRRGSAIARS